MNNNGMKKVNLIPSSYFLDKKLNVIRSVVAILCACAVLVVSGISVAQIFKLKSVENDLAEANKIIAEADFATLENLKTRYETLQSASDAGNFNTIPNVYEDMTDFLTSIVKNMPNGMKLKRIEGEFTNAGVYSYSFEFSAKERNIIPSFLQGIQNEPTLKYVNVSAITLNNSEVEVGNGNASDIVENTVQQSATGDWIFTLVVKTKGGAE